MNMKREQGYFRFAGISIIPVLAVLLISFSAIAGESRDPRNTGWYVVPGIKAELTEHGEENLQDDLCSINAIRRYLSANIIYPQAAAEAGHAGTIELYARLNNRGRIGDIVELQPGGDYIDIREIVIVADAPSGTEISESTRHESLVAESRRALTSLPRCDMQEIFGEVLKFTFKFVLK